MKTVCAYANANIALVKYWGKRESDLNIPAVSSLSMTLKDHGTKINLTEASSCELYIDGKSADRAAFDRLTDYLELVRRFFPFSHHFRIESQSTIPYASGLASSAAFFAALATALNQSLDLALAPRELSVLARLGSGSAARSIFSGFAGLYGGVDHEQAYAFSIEHSPALKLHMVVAVVSTNKKAISSRDAMKASLASPFFSAFVDSHQEDFVGAERALREGHFSRLGEIMEHSTLKMFSTMWSAQPAIVYWQPSSLALINAVYKLRAEHGPIAYFTLDAGPNVKILCQEEDLPQVLRTIAEMQVTERIFCTTPGEGAQVVQS